MGRSAPKYVKRVQAMLTERQYTLLQAHAQEIGKPLGVLVRETVDRALIKDLEQQRKQEALDWLFSQELPVDDWEIMERQIESGWEECQGE